LNRQPAEPPLFRGDQGLRGSDDDREKHRQKPARRSHPGRSVLLTRGALTILDERAGCDVNIDLAGWWWCVAVVRLAR
jgi:hypothetical protein